MFSFIRYICSMKKENLYEPFTVSFETLTEYPDVGDRHNFFELVYVLSGTGSQCINKNVFEYERGHLFLLTPKDCHNFTIETETQFFFLRFNDIYLKNSSLQNENIQRLEYILQNANHQPGCILKNYSDKVLIKTMIEAIMREHQDKDIYNKELIQQLVNTLIIVVARNIAKYLPEQVNIGCEAKAMDILQSIHNNIYYTEKIKAESISEHFGISGTYLGRYFKKHANETMQQYISNYKTKLIEHRLQFSEKRINEISYEFGFTDESHFNKFFKKQKGNSPSEFRKTVRLN
jgi:AraC-like DNA-binding protein